MKLKVFVSVLTALALLCAGALSETDPLDAWTGAYNAIAETHGAPLLKSSDFTLEKDGENEAEYYIYEPDDITILMLVFEDSGQVTLCGMQARADDESYMTTLACAFAASDSLVDYDTTYKTIQGIDAQLKSGKDMTAATQGSWYYLGEYFEEDGVPCVVVALTYIGAPESADEPEGSIWDGLFPDDGDEVPRTPHVTPKPDKKSHKA